MKAYTVHAPPGEAAPERFAFIKDGFSWPAFFFGFLWILWHRLWLVLIFYVLALLLLARMERFVGDDLATALALLAALFFASEANNLRRLSLHRRGWRELGSAQGAGLGEAEIDFFSRWKVGQGGTASAAAVRGPARRESPEERSDHDGPIFGLFPEPDR